MSHNASTIDSARRLQLGEMLVQNGRLTAEQLQEALGKQGVNGQGKLLGEILVELGFVTQLDVMECLARSYGVPFARVTPRIADPRMIDLLPRDFIDAQCVLPLFCVHDTLTIAISEPANLFLLDEIERLSGHKVQVVASTAQDIRATLQAYLPSANVFVIDEIYADVDVQEFSVVESEVVDIGEIEEASGQSPVIKLVNYVLYQATQERASDIHIEPDDHSSRIRYRIDGRLVSKLNPPYQMHPAVVSRIKIMAKMDISERRVPQDGDIHIVIDGRPIDLRVSTMPGKFGEKVVIRIIDSRNTVIPLEKMGMSKEMLDSWREVIANPNGMVLVTGPTGSGKSTTLYATLKRIFTRQKKLITLEDPVENRIPGVTQIAIRPEIGYTFATGLRAILRHDPDIVMLGEIRDQESAEVAARASLTGHLIFASL
ncbi:MAG: Flp pilus assembly complex ATPase component TadA, partial [Phycisphaerales bacterium]|nr:Flp pilus assembly complex ATPase component TadA [Phycisphaerales bacterium]